MKEMDGVEIGALVLVVAAVVLALLHWERVEHWVEYLRHEPAASAPAAVAASAAASAPAAVPAPPPPVLQVPAASSALPPLEHSDGEFGRALASLLGRADFEHWWIADGLIVHVIATVDNLGRAQVPVHAWPLHTAPGSPRVDAHGDELLLDPANAQRYAPYMAMVRGVDARALVAVYLRFYPLFQAAWRQLGYPSGQFNDRLLAVIDNLLAAPEPSGPLQLVQRHVLYRFADPALESASAGQKILMRIGLVNERAVKAKLRELRAELSKHMITPHDDSAHH
ncbi:hypothetical protein GALL_338230 [mine drainage metagenome]|uniref:DUF3014 domain-containing protein n=1 Tax=mine drainage metagenome TaxID=410659 RepID=A0A1J5QLG9_9ZZZZ